MNLKKYFWLLIASPFFLIFLWSEHRKAGFPVQHCHEAFEASGWYWGDGVRSNGFKGLNLKAPERIVDSVYFSVGNLSKSPKLHNCEAWILQDEDTIKIFLGSGIFFLLTRGGGVATLPIR